MSPCSHDKNDTGFLPVIFIVNTSTARNPPGKPENWCPDYRKRVNERMLAMLRRDHHSSYKPRALLDVDCDLNLANMAMKTYFRILGVKS